MSIEVLRTNRDIYSSGINILLYGRAGIGKTVSLSGLPDPIIISAEDGLLSLSGEDVPYVGVSSVGDLRDVFSWFSGSVEARVYESICIDSISEVSEIFLSAVRGEVGDDPRKLYPEVRSRVVRLMRSFMGLGGRHFVVTAREVIREVGKGEYIASPGIAGSRLLEDLPHIFDLVLHYTVGSGGREIRTGVLGGSVAKDRSGLLPGVLGGFNGFDVLGDIVNLIIYSGGRDGRGQ